jgi:hypothetical protein
VQNGILAKFEFQFNVHIFRGSQLYMYGSNMLIEYSLNALITVCHQSTKKGENESASRPLVDFGHMCQVAPNQFEDILPKG